MTELAGSTKSRPSNSGNSPAGKKRQRILQRKNPRKEQEHLTNDENDTKFKSYIAFFDLTLYCTYLYCSPSIEDNIGWIPSELIGTSAMHCIHPEDLPNITKLITANLTQNHPVSQLIQMRIKHKDPTEGEKGWVIMDILTTMCFDCMVCVACRADPLVSSRGLAWRSSAAEVIRFTSNGAMQVQGWKNRSRLIQMLSSPFASNITPINNSDCTGNNNLSGDTSSSRSEPRIVLILNRFTVDLNILYASLGCRMVCGMEASQLIGISLWQFISCKTQREQVRQSFDYLRESEQIIRLKFDWNASDTGNDDVSSGIPCSAVVTSACDGFVCVLRRLDNS